MNDVLLGDRSWTVDDSDNIWVRRPGPPLSSACFSTASDLATLANMLPKSRPRRRLASTAVVVAD